MSWIMTPGGLLMARGAFNLLFGLVLLAMMLQAGPAPGFSRGAFYALADGILVLASAVALMRSRERWLTPVVLADALLRLAAMTMIIAYPEMHQRIFGGAFFLSAVVVALIAVGIVGVLFVLVRKHAGRGAVVWLALTPFACTLLLGTGLAVAMLTGGERTMLAYYAVAAGLLLAYAGHRAGRTANPQSA